MMALCLSVFPLFCCLAQAAERTEAEVLRIAQDALRGTAPARQDMAVGHRTEVAGEARSGGSLRIVRRWPRLSLVEAGQDGFVVVSHDDRVKAVLGYGRTKSALTAVGETPLTSQSGTESVPASEGGVSVLPCCMEWYLDALNEVLESIADSSYQWTPVDVRPPAYVKQQVEPILTTDWNQSTPFNDWTPTFIDDKGEVQHFFTGCGCTAAAQVMFYHRHPAVGRGAMTYTYYPTHTTNEPIGENDYPVQLSCRFDTVSFDWDAMQAKYNRQRSDNEAANIAVARLCATLGIGQQMSYTEKSGSGTSAWLTAIALREFFGYSPYTRSLSRDNFTNSLWMNTLFEELSCGRPVIHSGRPQPDITGHLFVIDGYDADGLLHVNWGWGLNDRFDGYFDLNFLHPHNTDTHYSTAQTMVVNAQPEDQPLEWVSLTVATPGTLASMLPVGRTYRLKVSGTLNADDLFFLRRLGMTIKDDEGRIAAEMTQLDLSDAILPGDALPDSAFRSCTSLVHIDLPRSLRTIGDQAFRFCAYLTEIHIPESVRSIGASAFLNCYRLADITLGEGLEEIGSYAFNNCDSLRTMHLPSSLRSVGTSIFHNCDSLCHVEMSEDAPFFRIEDNLLFSKDGTQLLQQLAEDRDVLLVPSTVTSIGYGCSLNKKRLRAVVIPQGVTAIGQSAFNGCDFLRSVTSYIEQPPFVPLYAFAQVVRDSATLHIPAGTAPLYRRTQHWRTFRNIEEQEGTPLSLPFMLMSSWSQSAPFNADCPLVDGQPSPAGCGAVAVAQILNYYRQPATAIGHTAYHGSLWDYDCDVEADFDSHPFDWTHIRDVYDASASSADSAAVANLVFMTAVAMKTRFTPQGSSTGNAGSLTWGLQHYLHIAPTARYRRRKHYSTKEWTAMLDAQLEARRPVFYRGDHTHQEGAFAGHMFVIDGRDSAGRYHFNFGHDNSAQDKFATLTAINQGETAMAGNTSVCYHHQQAMLTDCYPVAYVTQLPRIEASLRAPMTLGEDPQAREVSAEKSVRTRFKLEFINFEADSICYSMGFFREGELQAVSPSMPWLNVAGGGWTYIFNAVFRLPSELSDGDYEMSLVTRDTEDSPWLQVRDDVPNRVPVTVSGGTFTFHLPDYHDGSCRLRLTVEPSEVTGFRDGGCTFDFAIHNPSTNNFEDSLRISISTVDGRSYEAFMPTSVYDGQTLAYRIFIADTLLQTATAATGETIAADRCNYSMSLYYRDTPTARWLPLTLAGGLLADVNGDGAVDVADIATVISVMASANVPDASTSVNADVNGDGTVDVADIATIISAMANAGTNPVSAYKEGVNGQPDTTTDRVIINYPQIP